MDSAQPALVIPAGESSGTAVARDPEGQEAVQMPRTKQPNSPSDGEALESHEVIELQTFIERKAWIEEKIKFLEKLPPIEVFVGIEALETSAEEIPGLPSRAQLQQWLVEHDVIEKETEIFDTGELKKLRKTTRAATQRNLSPEDTDLIELTLTTIYELDKLLHLLRDRSENLDLLGVRLTWEENRIASWVGRRKLIADLKAFLDTRARWSPAVYESTPGSTASLASVASESVLSSPGFARTARFTQAELLSRDAAQFAGRVTALRHGSITTAGKILDKLIDSSRKPVPEVLLDEQDKLEEMGVAQMESIGKFIMNVVMQWRKADETYVETMKDQTAANTLLSDIDAARFQHPTARQSASFTSRVDTLRKRLAIRGNPTSRNSAFPCPTHPLYPEQEPFNLSLAQSLSDEIASTLAILKTAKGATREYSVAYEAVKTFEALMQSANSLSDQYQHVLQRLESGVPADEGDGSPPNLHSEACLDPTAHSVFLALMPTAFNELDALNISATKALKSFPAALARLNVDGVDPNFKQEGVKAMERLKEYQAMVGKRRSELSERVDRLREARRLKGLIDDRTSHAQAIIREVDACMLKSRWRQSTSRNGAPPTPESPPSTPLPLLPSDLDFQHQIDELASGISRDITGPLQRLSSSLEPELKKALQRSSDELHQLLERGKRDISLLAAVKAQASLMETIRDEVNAWRLDIEDLKMRYDSTAQDYLQGQMDNAIFKEAAVTLDGSSDKLRVDVSSFIDVLPRRIQFVHRSSRESSNELPASDDGAVSSLSSLPFNLRSLDDAVRHDCNEFSMRLNGDLRTLEQKANHLHLAKMAKDVDAGVAASVAGINDATQVLASLKGHHQNVDQEHDVYAALTGLLVKIDDLSQTTRQAFGQSLSPVREVLRSMSTAPGVNDPAVHEVLFLARKRTLSDAELKMKSWDDQVQAFRTMVADAQRAELNRLEEVRLAEEERVRLEKERLAAEVAERDRLEREEQERIAALEAKQAEAMRLAAEAVRLKAEEEERERLEKERLIREDSERKHREEQRAAEDARRLAAQCEREALEQERLAMELKLRQAEEELAAERQAQADRLAYDLKIKLQAAADEQPQPLAFPATDETAEDVFGLKLDMGDSRHHKSQEIIDLQVRILNLRKRLRSLSISSVSRPASSSSSLPTEEELEAMDRSFLSICQEVGQLPSSIDDQSAQLELDSLKHEIDVSVDLMDRVRMLVSLTQAIALCDSALSDLLEHIDSYPALPLGPLSSSYRAPENKPAEDQLNGRLAFTKSAMDTLETAFLAVSDDPRAVAEHQRILQTWDELKDMANDRIHGRKSRPSSVVSSGPSSGRTSRMSLTGSLNVKPTTKKAGSYASLSVSAKSRGGLAIPSTSRRAVSNSNERSSSRMSTASNRSISGPMGFSVYGSTFASRQRTNSLTPNSTPSRRASGLAILPRMQTPTLRPRAASPSISEVSSVSNMASSRPSTSTSSWSRAPRMSFSTMPRSPPRRAPIPRKTYVANPKSKLDVAVGDVVNNLPVGINIEGVSGSWKDQSGKYWIGDQDPRLCFCRILRSQTVMVRVGGGWQELSKFIRGHFADSFRLLTESPQIGTREERWISAATLMEAPENGDSSGSPPHPPRTPEPTGPYLPSFAISTPSGNSPHSLKSTPSSNGSPLTPLQFLRRADPETPFLRPSTPSKPSTSRARTVPTPSRNSIWRP
ncbi:hypothetical protein BDZ89DRAFT_1066120 [Hymenopellis radicata]|nr:hypothetical protein BDZ89DRAFT_1066120 [Hymenopellis radicata]